MSFSRFLPSIPTIPSKSSNVLLDVVEKVDVEKEGELPKELAFAFLIAAKAVVSEEINYLIWWNTSGTLWLESLAARLGFAPEGLPPSPTPDDIELLASSIPESQHAALVLSVLSLCLLPPPDSPAGTPPLNYTAPTRAYLCRTLSILNIPQRHLLAAETHIAAGLFHGLLKSADVEAARQEHAEGWGGRWGRVAATVGGVILGGVAIGFTGGLAAPALLPLLPFLTAGTAPVVVGTLFGLTGGGLAGKRVSKRWQGVDRFEFVQVVGEKPKGGKVNGEKGTTTDQPPSLLATIVVPGILLESETEGVDAIRKCAEKGVFSHPFRDTFALSHSPSTMLATGKALNDWVKNKLLGTLKGQIIKRTALKTVFGIVALPMSVYKTTGMVVDNEWIRGCDRAKKAGQLLAEVLTDKVQGERPVVLVGVSLGALVVFEALQILGKAKTSPLIDSAILISLPVAPRQSEWKHVRNAVGRRLVNGYCSSDYVLAGVGRLHEILGGSGFSNISGLAPVNNEVTDIENVDLKEVVEGHFELNKKLPEIFRVVGISD